MTHKQLKNKLQAIYAELMTLARSAPDGYSTEICLITRNFDATLHNIEVDILEKEESYVH